ncbi:MAG: hypothetical protein EOO52_15570 [Gammaproteobacteria bacterium]|nr:MAG: hypothetical protein EOO52_15570 [Gammaproteobacteria bacterium]
MSILRAIAGHAILILGVYAGVIVIAGLSSGDIVQLSTHGNPVFHKSVGPSRFWIAISFWVLALVILISGGINLIRKNLTDRG